MENQTINITSNSRGKNTSTKGMQLTGNILSGDTFNFRDYIKTYCDGKWDKDNKVWIVNAEKIMTLLHTPGSRISIA